MAARLKMIYLPLDHGARIFDLDKFILLLVEEIEGEIFLERVVGEEDTF